MHLSYHAGFILRIQDSICATKPPVLPTGPAATRRIFQKNEDMSYSLWYAHIRCAGTAPHRYRLVSSKSHCPRNDQFVDPPPVQINNFDGPALQDQDLTDIRQVTNLFKHKASDSFKVTLDTDIQ